LSGWADEPWEVSEWDSGVNTGNLESRWVLSDTAKQQRDQPAAPTQSAPIVQNFNLNVAEKAGDDGQGLQRKEQGKSGSRVPYRTHPNDGRQTSSPLAKLRQPSSGTMNAPIERQQARQSARSSRPQKPCITDFCGLKKPDINGFWVAQDGEMLGIKNNRYLWSDGGTRNLTGQLKLQNEYLLMKIDGYEKVKRFKYKLAGDHLLTMQPDGKIREFVRTPNNYSGQYPAQRYGW
jgi:hypothetical protein